MPPRSPRGRIRPPDAGAGGSALLGGLPREKQSLSATGSARDARDDCSTPNPGFLTPGSIEDHQHLYLDICTLRENPTKAGLPSRFLPADALGWAPFGGC